jgi:hypothetical protein
VSSNATDETSGLAASTLAPQLSTTDIEPTKANTLLMFSVELVSFVVQFS